MDFGLKEQSKEKAIKEFSNVLGAEGEWFLKIIEFVVQKRKEGKHITDIFIREEAPPLIGILKAFFYSGLNNLKVDRTAIRDFVQAILEYSERQALYIDLTLNKRKSIDFSFSLYGLGVFRVNYSQDQNGDALNIRVLDFVIPEFEDMLFPEMYVEFFNRQLLVRRSINLGNSNVMASIVRGGGLIIHSGATGSGKTTAIASEIKFLADHSNGLILTYENPVEYRFLPSIYPNVRQLEIERHLYWDEIYYHFLRNSPAVGLIGEIRNREEFLQVLDLASRGHLVITTMHARNVIETIVSFLSYLEENQRELFLSVIRCVVSHKLYLSESGRIIPFYEILIFNDVVRNFFLKETGINLPRIVSYFYKEYKARLVESKVFYPFEICFSERKKENLISGNEVSQVKELLEI